MIIKFKLFEMSQSGQTFNVGDICMFKYGEVPNWSTPNPTLQKYDKKVAVIEEVDHSSRRREYCIKFIDDGRSLWVNSGAIKHYTPRIISSTEDPWGEEDWGVDVWDN